MIFSWHTGKPIPVEERASFQGLRYYPPDPNFRFELELDEHNRQRTIEIEDIKGALRKFLRWGEFRFNVGSERCVLQAYKGTPDEERLFVPFRGATSGQATYGAGRCLRSGFKRSDREWEMDS